jgi:hypothetical protein
MAELVKQLRYEEAVSRGLATLRAGADDPRRLGPVYLQLGVAYYLLGDEPRARRHFVQMYAVDPDARLTADLSPKLRSAVDAVRTEFFKLALDHPSPGGAYPGEPLAREARLGGVGARVDRVVAQWRVRGGAAFQPVRLQKLGTRYRGTLAIPQAIEPDGAIEYYLEARTAGGDPVAALGTEAAPLAVPVRARPPGLAVIAAPGPTGPVVPPPAPTPLYERPAVWVGAAIVVVALVGTLIYIAASGPDKPGNPMMMMPGQGGLDVCIKFDDLPCR